MCSPNPSSLLELLRGIAAYTVAEQTLEAVEVIGKMDTQITAKVLELNAPQCNHPACWEAFKGIKELVMFCHKIHMSPEFATLQKSLNKHAENMKVAQKLHKQRN